MSYWGKSQAELNAKELEERRKFKGIGMPIKLKLPHTCADGLLEYDTNQVAERIIVESNAGINVVGSYEPPVSSFLGKQASRDQASFSATCDFRPRPDPEYEDFDCPEWGEGLDLDLPPIPSRWLDDIRPVGEMDHGVAGAGSDYGIISEEVSASPIADSLLAGAKLATLSEASAGNGLEVARMVETWWGTETGVVKRLMDSGVVDVSVARAATDYASRSNQILGMDNYAGHVRVEKSAVTKEMFTPEEASNLGYQAVVDFGRIIAAVKFSLMMTYAYPALPESPFEVVSWKSTLASPTVQLCFTTLVTTRSPCPTPSGSTSLESSFLPAPWGKLLKASGSFAHLHELVQLETRSWAMSTLRSPLMRVGKPQLLS